MTRTTKDGSRGRRTTLAALAGLLLLSLAVGSTGGSAVAATDTTKPVVRITAPTAGSTVTGTTVLRASATDGTGVSAVSFWEGSRRLGYAAADSGSWRLDLDTRSLQEGPLVLTAKARDAAGNIGTSSAVRVVVSHAGPTPGPTATPAPSPTPTATPTPTPSATATATPTAPAPTPSGTPRPDTKKPTAVITAPRSGATVSGSTTFIATATDDVAVTAVSFWSGSTRLGNAVQRDGGDWVLVTSARALDARSHTILAKARDAAGNIGSSAAITIVAVATASPTPTSSPTATPAPSVTPTATPTPAPTVSPTATPTPTPQPPTPGVPVPLAQWDFSEAAAPYRTTVGDLPLTQAGRTAALSTTTPWGTGIRMTGTSYLRIPAASTGRLTVGATGNAVTVAAWVDMTDTNAGFIAGPWKENSANPGRSYGLFYDLSMYGGDERANFHVSRTGGPTPGYPYSRDYSASGQNFTRNVWQLHVGTYDGTQAVSYLDGAAVAIPRFVDNQKNVYAKNPYLFPDGLNPTPGDFTVGAVELSTGPGNYAQGTFAKLRVWDRALTADEVRALYEAERTALG
ncbi:Ig-like domain-containing protein [Rathayibacter oskolensis]|nr:Ig-like domain-containing protein [Rathayibacter oskolensis]